MARAVRVFVEPTPAGAEVALRSDDAHHLARVLRLAPGAPVTGFDGEGRLYEAVIAALGPRGGALRILSIREEAPPASPRLVLAVALVRLDPYEWLIQKATELGCDRFLPLVAEHCSRGQGLPVARARLERWRRISLESLKQCRRSRRMDVAPPEPAGAWFASWPSTLPGAPSASTSPAPEDSTHRWILHPEGASLAGLLAGSSMPTGVSPERLSITPSRTPTQTTSRSPSRTPLRIPSIVSSVDVTPPAAPSGVPSVDVTPPAEAVVAVGPEGGWSDGEVRLAEEHGFVRCGLGEAILRTETAALAALSLLQGRYHWGGPPRG